MWHSVHALKLYPWGKKTKHGLFLMSNFMQQHMESEHCLYGTSNRGNVNRGSFESLGDHCSRTHQPNQGADSFLLQSELIAADCCQVVVVVHKDVKTHHGITHKVDNMNWQAQARWRNLEHLNFSTHHGNGAAKNNTLIVQRMTEVSRYSKTNGQIWQKELAVDSSWTNLPGGVAQDA